MSLNIYVDVQNKVLVKSNLSTIQIVLPPFFFSTEVDLNIYPLIPNPVNDPAHPFIAFDWTGYAISVEIGKADADDSSVPAAITSSFTPISGGVNGLLDLNTLGVKELIGTASSVRSNFEIKATPPGGSPDVAVQVGINLNGVVLSGAPNPPQTLPQFILRSEVNAGFVKKIGDNGDVIEIRSPSGQWSRVLGITDAGVKTDDVIQNF